LAVLPAGKKPAVSAPIKKPSFSVFSPRHQPDPHIPVFSLECASRSRNNPVHHEDSPNPDPVCPADAGNEAETVHQEPEGQQAPIHRTLTSTPAHLTCGFFPYTIMSNILNQAHFIGSRF
jgi:hypothetical protein